MSDCSCLRKADAAISRLMYIRTYTYTTHSFAIRDSISYPMLSRCQIKKNQEFHERRSLLRQRGPPHQLQQPNQQSWPPDHLRHSWQMVRCLPPSRWRRLPHLRSTWSRWRWPSTMTAQSWCLSEPPWNYCAACCQSMRHSWSRSRIQVS